MKKDIVQEELETVRVLQRECFHKIEQELMPHSMEMYLVSTFLKVSIKVFGK